tara:strand:+ start:5042 stop:5599 length:558 start_codon:yes stop_codon:yes gene_type:complete
MREKESLTLNRLSEIHDTTMAFLKNAMRAHATLPTDERAGLHNFNAAVLSLAEEQDPSTLTNNGQSEYFKNRIRLASAVAVYFERTFGKEHASSLLAQTQKSKVALLDLHDDYEKLGAQELTQLSAYAVKQAPKTSAEAQERIAQRVKALQTSAEPPKHQDCEAETIRTRMDENLLFTLNLGGSD